MSRRILHVLASPHLGGAEWMCLYLAHEQQTRGDDVLIHFFDAGTASEQAQRMGLRTEIQNVTSYSRRARWEGFAHGLKRSLQTHPPDIIHSHVPLTHLICHRVVPSTKIPWVCTSHGSWRQFGYAPQTVRKPWLRPYLQLRHALGDRLTTRSAKRIACVSDTVRRDLIRVGIPARKLVTIHNGLPARRDPLSKSDARARLQLPSSAHIIGSLGYFAPVKGHHLLIRAFARLAPQFPDLLLLIAGGDVLGDSAYRQKLVHLCDSLKVTERVRLLSSLDPQAGFMASLDTYVVASLTEGMPLSLIEAMQHGLPSVISSAGGSQEAARPDLESLVFRSGDTVDLAGKLAQLIQNVPLQAALGRSAADRARIYLTVDRCATEYELLYASVLENLR